MASTDGQAITQFLDGVTPIVTMERDGLVVLALDATTDTAGPAYRTLEEATQAEASNPLC